MLGALLYSFLSCFLRPSLSLNLELTELLDKLVIQWIFTCPVLDSRCMPPYLALYIAAGYPHSGPLAYSTHTLYSLSHLPSPQSSNFYCE